MIPARHFLELCALPEIALATAVRAFFLRYPGAFAPTGNELILVALPPILLTLSLRTLTLFGPPRVASTPRSLAEKETERSSA
eukprot:2097907-Heterocapsa_arctica.AAC.1